MKHSLCFQGEFFWQKANRHGKIIARGGFNNSVVTAGLNHILETQFRSGSQVASWYAGLIDNASFSALAASDTMSSHAGWIENTDYTESVRQQWSPGAASGGIIINTAAMQFTMDDSKTIQGVFIASDNTKSGTSGTLWATALFDSSQEVSPGEYLKIFYRLKALAGSG